MKHWLFQTDSRTGRLAHTANLVAALLLIAALLYASLFELTSISGWKNVANYWRMFTQGWLLTLQLSAAAMLGSLLVGFFLAFGKRSHFLPWRALSTVWVELIRGTPLLVQILILYYGVFARVGLENRFLASVLILSSFSGAYISEIIRAGIESVGATQIDSARAIGLNRFQTYRHVIFPQAFRQMLPPLAGQFASLIKDSSLLSIIGISEFTLNAQQVNSFTYSTLESYLPLALGYLILTLPISLWTQSLERRHRFES